MTILINPFEVPAETTDEEFLADWQVAADHLRRQPGFVDAQLHRSLSPDARFRFINVAHWESPDAFRTAVTSEAFRRIAGRGVQTNHPALYQVVTSIQSQTAVTETGHEKGATS